MGGESGREVRLSSILTLSLHFTPSPLLILLIFLLMLLISATCMGLWACRLADFVDFLVDFVDFHDVHGFVGVPPC